MKKPGITTAAVLLCSSGISAALAEILPEVMRAAAVIIRLEAIPGAGAFRVLRVRSLQAEAPLTVQESLEALSAEEVLAAAPLLTAVAESEDRE
jgi:hypothetical protein